MDNICFPHTPKTVTGIGCVIRLYSGSDVNDFKKLVTQILKVGFSACIFIMDRRVGNNGITLDSAETALKNIIDEYEGAVLLLADEHYNGTGAFNIAFNYIREHNEYEQYLWQFCDDDDFLDDVSIKMLMDFILNPTQRTTNGYKQFGACNGTTITIGKEKYNMSSAEQSLYRDIDGFNFTTDLIINHATVTKTHLYESMHKTDCNIWSFLFSPYYFNNLSCRLVPFGREDMDMINYLMCAVDSTYYNGTYKSLINSQNVSKISKSKKFRIPNNLIRINGIIRYETVVEIEKEMNRDEVNTKIVNKDNPFNFYKHESCGGSGGYADLAKLYNYSDTCITYMNNHQKEMQNGIQKSLYPCVILNKQNPKYFLNVVDGYTRDSDEYGINKFNHRGIPWKEFHNDYIYKDDVIKNNENLLGELYIAKYYQMKPINGSGSILENYMFMNGKTPSHINNSFIGCVNPIIVDFCNARGLTLPSTDVNGYKTLFNNVFGNVVHINEWNKTYATIADTDGRKKVPTHAFGGNGSNTLMKTIMLLVVFFLIIVIIVVCIIRYCCYKRSSLSNTTNKQTRKYYVSECVY